MNFVRFISLFIGPAMLGYHKLLMEDFENSQNYAELVNKLFYSNFSFQEFLEWYKEMDIVDFDEFILKGGRSKIPECCKLEDLNVSGYKYEYIKDIKIKKYQFFSEERYPSVEAARASFPRPYFAIRKDFVEYFDDLIFSSLSSFKRNNQPSQVEKELFEGVSIVFDKKRNDMYFSALQDYVFPDVSFKINGKLFKCNLKTDLKSFVFCDNSFSFFDAQYISYTKNEHQRLILHYKTGEPVIYHFAEENYFMVSNSDTIFYNGNDFILLVAELFLHYYTVFEKWATEFLKQNYTKIISHPEF